MNCANCFHPVVVNYYGGHTHKMKTVNFQGNDECYCGCTKPKGE